MTKEEEIKFFNEKAKMWEDTERGIKVGKDFIDKLQIENDSSVLDIGAGTGILYRILKDYNNIDYVGIDIAEKMVKEFLKLHPEADVRKKDYELECKFNKNFDFIIIYDTIPHFRKLDMVFKNTAYNLKSDGKYSIIHSKTRKRLKEHHKNIGHKQDHEPIPSDEKLKSLSKEYGFKNVNIEDKQYFMFWCEKK